MLILIVPTLTALSLTVLSLTLLILILQALARRLVPPPVAPPGAGLAGARPPGWLRAPLPLYSRLDPNPAAGAGRRGWTVALAGCGGGHAAHSKPHPREDSKANNGRPVPAQPALPGELVPRSGQEGSKFGAGDRCRKGRKGSQGQKGCAELAGVYLAGVEQHLIHGLKQTAGIWSHCATYSLTADSSRSLDKALR